MSQLQSPIPQTQAIKNNVNDTNHTNALKNAETIVIWENTKNITLNVNNVKLLWHTENCLKSTQYGEIKCKDYKEL